MTATITALPARGNAMRKLLCRTARAVMEDSLRADELAQRAAANERTRIAAILRAPNATGRRELAERLALETSLPVTLALSILATAAAEVEAPATG